eukprot:6205817-Pleurochrysis_carterae.AAC.2
MRNGSKVRMCPHTRADLALRVRSSITAAQEAQSLTTDDLVAMPGSKAWMTEENDLDELPEAALPKFQPARPVEAQRKPQNDTVLRVRPRHAHIRGQQEERSPGRVVT